MTARPKVYLAGPGVFLPDAVEYGRRKQALCERHGFEGLYPLDDVSARESRAERRDTLIYRACIGMIDHADCGIFDLTPFRGPSADAGTVFELGMLVGLGKPVFGYSNTAEEYLARVRTLGPLRHEDANATWRDVEGMAVEDFGNADNLMLDVTFREAGFPLIRIAAAPEERFRDLRGLEACLDLAKGALLRKPTSRPDRR